MLLFQQLWLILSRQQKFSSNDRNLKLFDTIEYLYRFGHRRLDTLANDCLRERNVSAIYRSVHSV